MGRALALGLVLLAVAPAAAADARLRWTPARTVAPAEGPPTVGIARGGDALAVWSRLPAQQDPSGGNLERGRAILSSAPPGRGFARPRALREAAVLDPQIAMNARGDAAVVWQRGDRRCARQACTNTLRIAIRPAGGRFGPARNVGRAVDLARGPFAIVGPDRGIAVVWQEGSFGREGRVMASYARPGRGFSRPRLIGRTRDMFPDLRVADNGRGQAAVAWWVGGSSCVRVAVLRAGGRFAGPAAVRSPQRCGALSGLSVGARGHVGVTWVGRPAEVTATGPFRNHAAVARPGSRRFGYAGFIEGVARADVAVAPDGGLRLYRAVEDDPGTPPFVLPTYRLETVLRPPGGRFGRVQVLANRTHAPGFQLAFDSRGRAVAAWLAPGDRRIAAAHGQPGRRLGRAQRIGRASGPLSARIALGVAGGGEAVALWHHGDRLVAARAVPR